MTVPTDWFKHPTGKIPQGAYCDHCGRYNTRHCTVSAVVINEGGQVLLTKRQRDPQAGWWCLPGGYVDWNETVEECVARELAEEVGLTISPSECELLGVFSSPTRDLDGRQNIDCAFMVRVAQPAITANESEVVEWQWCNPAQLPSEVAFDHRDMIATFVRRQAGAAPSSEQ